MYWLKNCPRCTGDLGDATDIYGGYIACLNCGHHLTEKEEAELRGREPPAEVPVLAAPGAGVLREGNPQGVVPPRHKGRAVPATANRGRIISRKSGAP